MDSWVLFADMLPVHERERMLDGLREALWAEGKTLGAARERVLARARRLGASSHQPAAFLMLRRIKQVTAELEFLQELRRDLELAPEPEIALLPREDLGDDGLESADGRVGSARRR